MNPNQSETPFVDERSFLSNNDHGQALSSTLPPSSLVSRLYSVLLLNTVPSVPKPRLFSYVNTRWCYFVTNSVPWCWKPPSSIVSQFTVQLYIFLLFKWMISWASLRPEDLRKSWQTIFLNSAILTAYKIGLTNELAVVSIVKVSATWKFHS